MNIRLLLILSLAVTIMSACSTSKIVNSTISDGIITELDTIEIIGSRSSGEYKETAERKHDLIHTTLEVHFDWEKQHLLGEAYLILKPYFYPTSKLVLDAKGFDLHKVGLLGSQRLKTLDYTYDSLRIYIDLDRTYEKDENFEIYIAYTAKPNDLVAKDAASFKNNKGLYFINHLGEDTNKPMQIWTQGETESASCWFPTLDQPNERCTQEMYITVEDKYITFSNGKLVSTQRNDDGTRTDIWRQSLPHAPYLFAMTVGSYAMVRDYWRDIEVNYYVEPDYEPYAKDIFGNTPEMLELYSNLFGVDYPWEKYSQIVVRDFVAGAMENTSATIHYSALHSTRRELLDRSHEDIIAHEVMHQWFGDLVTCESWSNIPLNEALATYGEHLWFEHKYGLDEANYRLNNDLNQYLTEAETKQEKLIRFYYDDEDEMFDAHSYQKGGRVMHMLRNFVGDEAFFASLNLYLKTHQFKAAEIHHLRLAFEEVTGKDLNWFFNQWFFEAGHPVLDVNYKYFEDEVVVTIDQESSTGSDMVYRLPIAIDVYTNAGKTRHQVVLQDKTSEFRFETVGRALLVNVDADKILVCEKTDEKELYEYAYQFNNGPHFMDRFEAIEGLVALESKDAVVIETLKEALSDPHWKIRNLALNYLHPDESNGETIALIAAIAKQDDKSDNRADAITILAESESGMSYEDVIKMGLNDQSYGVMAAALEGLSEIDEAAALEVAAQYESHDNSDLISAVASVYSIAGGAEMQQFFETQIAKRSGFSKYYLLYYYGRFLSRMNIEQIEKALPTLTDNAINGNSSWVRYAGKLSLENIRKSFTEKKDQATEDLERAASNEETSNSAELKRNLEYSEYVLDLVEDALNEVKEKRKSGASSTN